MNADQASVTVNENGFFDYCHLSQRQFPILNGVGIRLIRAVLKFGCYLGSRISSWSKFPERRPAHAVSSHCASLDRTMF